MLSVLEMTLSCLRSIQLDKNVCLELRKTDLGLSQMSKVTGMSYRGKSGEMVAATGTRSHSTPSSKCFKKELKGLIKVKRGLKMSSEFHLVTSALRKWFSTAERS